jgi:GNAT superfamily N-acetyltransferase
LLPHFLLAEVDGELVGCCTLIPKDGHAYFGMFAVRPGMQGGGIGSALLAAAEARTRALGLPAVEMTVLSPRTELIAFYERRGYVATGEVRPFPYGDPRFGLPRRDDLTLAVYVKTV